MSSNRSVYGKNSLCHISTVTPPSPLKVRGLRRLIAGKKASFNRLYSDDSIEGCGDMSLHYACQKHPKLSDIVAICENNHKSLQRANESGQFPLHVAVANALSTEVIIYLVLQYPQACRIADVYGKYPLHYATLSTGWIVKGGGIFEDIEDFVHPDYTDMVKLICNAFPGALINEDNDGRNPIELALLDSAPVEIVKMLQRTSVKYQRARDTYVTQEPLVPMEIHVISARGA
jgi:hypothetical protein